MADITFTIPDNKLADFKAGFLRAIPVPVEIDGTPRYGENEWIKLCGKNRYVEAYRRGKKLIAEDSAQTDNEIIS